MDTPQPVAPSDDQVQQQINTIIAQTKGVSTELPSPEAQEHFLRGFSMAALVYSFVYFRAMRDATMTWLSVVFALLFFPGLFVVPFQARRRAWASREWVNFNEFQAVQRSWDRAAWYGVIVMIVVLYLAMRMVYAALQPLLDSVNSTGDPVQQLRSLQEELQSY